MSRIEGAGYPGIEEKLYNSAAEAARFFKEKKFNVERGNHDDTHPLHKEFETGCGDDRYVNNGGNMLAGGYATRASLIGGVHLVIAETTNGGYGSAQIVHERANSQGVTLTYHGDEKEGIHGCAAYKLLMTKNYAIPPDLDGHPDIPYHVLSGNHTANMITLNFLPFTAAVRTRRSITHDFYASHVVGVEDSRAIRFIHQLSVGLGINKVKIII